MLTKHVTHADHLKHMKQHHFHQGFDAFEYLRLASAAAMNATALRKLRVEWDTMDLLELVGVQEHTVSLLGTKIMATNAEFPAAAQKNRTECSERFLEMLMDSSKLFNENATDEYNQTAGSRRFEHTEHAVHGNHRDFDGLIGHYDQLWSAAFNSKLPGFDPKPPTKRPAPSVAPRHIGMPAEDFQVGREAPSGQSLGERGMAAVDIPPRPGSPSRTIIEIANAGLEIAQHRGTTSTTDLSNFDPDTLCIIADDGYVEGEGELGLLFDADDVASVEMICDCCRGLGHVRARCPSNRNRYRSLSYVIGVLQTKLHSIKNKAPRRQPGRGQRPPFRAQPRRFHSPAPRPLAAASRPVPGRLRREMMTIQPTASQLPQRVSQPTEAAADRQRPARLPAAQRAKPHARRESASDSTMTPSSRPAASLQSAPRRRPPRRRTCQSVSRPISLTPRRQPSQRASTDSSPAWQLAVGMRRQWVHDHVHPPRVQVTHPARDSRQAEHQALHCQQRGTQHRLHRRDGATSQRMEAHQWGEGARR